MHRSTFTIPEVHREQMLAHVLLCLPEEACGFLGGKDGRCEVVLPVSNALHSPVLFRMEPQEQLEAMLHIEARGLEIAAIYHSHPRGPALLSETDLREFQYPGALMLLWYPQKSKWHMRCYSLEKHGINELKLGY